MSTTDVLLLVIAALFGLLTLAWLVIAFLVVKLLGAVRSVVERAEDMIDSVESAADVLKDVHGRLALFKLVQNIIKLVQRSRK